MKIELVSQLLMNNLFLFSFLKEQKLLIPFYNLNNPPLNFENISSSILRFLNLFQIVPLLLNLFNTVFRERSSFPPVNSIPFRNRAQRLFKDRYRSFGPEFPVELAAQRAKLTRM